MFYFIRPLITIVFYLFFTILRILRPLYNDSSFINYKQYIKYILKIS